jgi:uncharacterized membrane protein
MTARIWEFDFSATENSPLAAIPTGGQVVTLFVWFLLVAGLAAAGLYAAVALRRWSNRDQRSENFTFQDLRDMRARGDITEAEFKAMRGALLAEVDLGTSLAGAADELAPPPPRRRPNADPPDDDVAADPPW